MATGADYNTSWWSQHEALNSKAKTYVGRTVTTSSGRTGVVQRAYVRDRLVQIVATDSQGHDFHTTEEDSTLVELN